MKNLTKLVLAGCLLAMPVAAHAQEQGTETERQSCEPDVNSICKDAIPDKPRIIQCLVKNVLSLSPPCANVIRFYTQQRFCAPDAARVCSDVPATDREGVVKCLEQKTSKLGGNCRNALKSFLSAGRS